MVYILSEGRLYPDRVTECMSIVLENMFYSSQLKILKLFPDI